MTSEKLDFWKHTQTILDHLRPEGGGVLCTVANKTGHKNVLSLAWGQIGPFYHDHPVFIIAVAPARYSWQFLKDVPEFVIAVPGHNLTPAVQLCGTKSGRDCDKFAAARLTPMRSHHVLPPSIEECPINVECRIYAAVDAPHMLLTPEHRQRAASEQHTIFFAEVLGTYRHRNRTIP